METKYALRISGINRFDYSYLQHIDPSGVPCWGDEAYLFNSLEEVKKFKKRIENQKYLMGSEIVRITIDRLEDLVRDEISKLKVAPIDSLYDFTMTTE